MGVHHFILLFYSNVITRLFTYTLSRKLRRENTRWEKVTRFQKETFLHLSSKQGFSKFKTLTLVSVDKNLAYGKTATETHSCALG